MAKLDVNIGDPDQMLQWSDSALFANYPFCDLQTEMGFPLSGWINLDATLTSNYQPTRFLDPDCWHKFTYWMTNSVDPGQPTDPNLHCSAGPGLTSPLNRPVHITKTHLYNFNPLKPHFYIVKPGFTWVFIIFHISAQNIDCGTC